MALAKKTANDTTDLYKLLLADADTTVGATSDIKLVATLQLDPAVNTASHSFAAGATQTGNFNVDDIISGGSGDDWLYGLGGNDTLFGVGGNDVLHGGAGADIMFGGTGIDTISYQYSTSVIINLGIHAASGGDAEGDQFWEVENVIGSDDADWIYGDSGDNFLDGEGGTDVMWGGGGNDYLFGGDEHDTLWGEEGDDTLAGGNGPDELFGGLGDDQLFGGSGGDNLYGNDGNDRIDGGGGVDIMEGGDGADTFVHYAALPDMGDLITDFDPLEDILELHGIANADDPNVQLIQNDDGDAQLNFSGGGSLTLQDVHVSATDTVADLAQQITIDYVA